MTPNPTMADGTVLDPKVLKVVRAIRQIESGGDYNAVGDNGKAHGAYQWNANGLWERHARMAGVDPNDFSPAAQNKAAYFAVKELKDKGLQPDEIAATWNGGHKDKMTGRIVYNNPVYGEKFRNALMSQGAISQPQVEQPIPEQNIPQQRQELQAQGEPVSVNEFKAQPTGVGKFIRGVLKPFASAATTLTPVYRELKSVVQGQGVPDYQDLYAPVKSKYLGDIYSPGAKGIVKLSQAQNVGDVAKGALQATADIAGKGLEIGSYAMAPGAVGSLKTLPAIGRTALEGAKIGFTSGLGTGLQSASEQTNVGQALKDVAFQAGGGALAGGVLGGATTGLIKGVSGIKNVIKPSEKAVADAINSLEKTYTDISTGTLTGKKNLNKILSKTESMNKAGTEGVTPMRKLAEDGIVPSTKGTKLDTFQQAQDYRAKVEPLYEVNKKALQEVGLSTAPVQLSDLEQGALEYAKTPENINSGRYAKMASEIKGEFNLLRENYPDGVVPLNVVDDIKSARWSNVFKNKGFIESDVLKKDSEYAIAKSLQKTIEKIAEDAGHADVAQLNREIGSILDASKFLESLDGKTLKGGRVGKYVGTLIGSTIGNSLPAKIVGALGGNVVADILIKSDVQSPVRRLILSKLEQSSPKAYEATLKWLAEQDALRMTRLQLPAPKNVGPIVNQGRPIQVAPTGSTAEYIGKDVVAQSKSPINQQTVAATNNVTNTSIPTELPKSKVKSSDLSTGEDLVTVYHASPKLPKNGNWRTGTYFAETPEKASYYASSHHRGKIDVQEVKIPRSKLSQQKTNGNYTLNEEFPVKESVLPKVNKVIPELEKEAKKYKSAEEFVKAQGTPVYRGEYSRKQNLDNAISTSLNKDVAKSFNEKGVIKEMIVDKNARIIDISDLRKQILGVENLPNPSSLTQKQFESITGNNLINYAKEKGYDVIDYSKAGIKSSGIRVGKLLDEQEYKIINPSVIKTKSQLEEIWKKANKSPLPKPKTKSSDLSTGVKKAFNNAKETLKTLKDKNVRERGSISLESILPERKPKGNQGVSLAKNTTEDLIQQAKKYKSAEEFVKAISPSYSKLPDSPLYHGTSANIKNGKLTFGVGDGAKKGGQSGGHFLSDSKQISETFAGNNGKVYIVDPSYKKSILDLTKPKGVKEVENYIGNKYKTYDGEILEFTRDDFEIMFPGGKTDFASISQYPELIEQITKRKGYKGIAFDEYAGGKTGKTYQILHSDNIPVIEQKKISDSELSKLIKEKTDLEPKATDLRLEEYGRNQDGYLTDSQINELYYLEKRMKEIDNILISSDYKSQLEEIWKKANKK